MARNNRKGMKAQRVQRRRMVFKKRKPAYKHGRKTAPKLFSTREVKHIETEVESAQVKFLAAGAQAMKNGVIMYPAGFNSTTTKIPQGTGCHAVIGCFIRPLYLSQKFKVNFSNLDLDKAVANSGLRLRCRSGWVRTTGHKSGAGIDGTSAQWQTDIDKEVHHLLQEADMDSDYLQYVRKSRNIMIVKDSFIKPRMNQRMGSDPAGANVHAQDTFAPEVNFTINWDKTKGWLRNKTRLEPVANPATDLVLNNTFIPFVYWSCEQFTNLDEGHISIKSSSRYYFTDA